MKFNVMININNEYSNFNILADSVDDALCKTADIYDSMGMTGDSLNISIMKMNNIDVSEPKPKKPYWRGNKQTEPESEPQAVER